MNERGEGELAGILLGALITASVLMALHVYNTLPPAAPNVAIQVACDAETKALQAEVSSASLRETKEFVAAEAVGAVVGAATGKGGAAIGVGAAGTAEALLGKDHDVPAKREAFRKAYKACIERHKPK